MVRWAVLQLLIGNSDARGKNLSFFMNSAGLVPAPLYDLVSINVYGENVEQDRAMPSVQRTSLHLRWRTLRIARARSRRSPEPLQAESSPGLGRWGFQLGQGSIT
jgi:hypothetical protein